jgi:hypothetical protein
MSVIGLILWIHSTASGPEHKKGENLKMTGVNGICLTKPYFLFF